MVIALGLKPGWLASAHTSPLLGSTTAVAAPAYGVSASCATAWICGRRVMAMSAPGTISVSSMTVSGASGVTATSVQPGVPRSRSSAPYSSPLRPTTSPDW